MTRTPLAKRSRATKSPRAATPPTANGVRPRRSPQIQRRQKYASPRVQPRRESLRIKNRREQSDESSTAQTLQEQVQPNQDGQNSPTIASPEAQHQDTPPATSGSGPPNPANIWKIYMDGELYSIFDRQTRQYIYHKHRHAERGYAITYINNQCTTIHDRAGKLVYSRP
ncbi:hypothetical protein GGR51DRAFT_578423 [Nemania sp. FL0031]|nr:hypothetical protein GGR51DRAFT_578423 [Nemania sp. FL0031]